MQEHNAEIRTHILDWFEKNPRTYMVVGWVSHVAKLDYGGRREDRTTIAEHPIALFSRAQVSEELYLMSKEGLCSYDGKLFEWRSDTTIIVCAPLPAMVASAA